MNSNQKKTKSLATVAASAAALYSISGVVNAGLILDDTNGFTVSGNQSVEWDVDGNGVTDFTFHANSFDGGEGGQTYTSSFGSASRSIRGSGNFVSSASAFGGFTNQFFVSPQTASNNLNANGQMSNGLNFVASTSTSFFGSTNTNVQNQFVDGNGLLGFKVFNPAAVDSSDYFLGWADITVTSGGLSASLAINSWCYSDNNAPVHVGTCETVEMPEPPMSALLALGLGAIGIRRWKAHRKAQAAA